MAVTPINQLLLTLRYYALGSMIISAADFVGVHLSTACRIIHRVTTAIADLAPEEIKFPHTPDGILALQTKFYEIARFPQCIVSATEDIKFFCQFDPPGCFFVVGDGVRLLVFDNILVLVN
jgi:hypothetical protein